MQIYIKYIKIINNILILYNNNIILTIYKLYLYYIINGISLTQMVNYFLNSGLILMMRHTII